MWKAWTEVWTDTNLVKTSSTYDTTPGAMLKVGDFGLGATDLVDLVSGTDLNTIYATGFYQSANGVVNNPSGMGSGQMIVMTNAGKWSTQIYYPQSNTKMFFRTSNNGVWTSWNEVWQIII